MNNELIYQIKRIVSIIWWILHLIGRYDQVGINRMGIIRSFKIAYILNTTPEYIRALNRTNKRN